MLSYCRKSNQLLETTICWVGDFLVVWKSKFKCKIFVEKVVHSFSAFSFILCRGIEKWKLTFSRSQLIRTSHRAQRVYGVEGKKIKRRYRKWILKPFVPFTHFEFSGWRRPNQAFVWGKLHASWSVCVRIMLRSLCDDECWSVYNYLNLTSEKLVS